MPIITSTCVECGESLQIESWQMRRGRGKFCSIPCRQASMLRKSWEARRARFEKEFWAKVDQSARPSGCWPFLGSNRRGGYGRLIMYGKYHLAHRVSYRLAIGEIPDGLLVCHRCDNPPCCNPQHLFLGDHLANMRDRDAKGRASLHRAKITANDAARIKGRLAAGELGITLAKEFCISQTAISRIKVGRTWQA